MKCAEHDDSTVAGCEGIGTRKKVLTPTELKTNGPKNGQSEGRDKIENDSQKESDVAAGNSDGSHTKENDDLRYINDACDVSNCNCHG